jgi:hypothetical protein
MYMSERHLDDAIDRAVRDMMDVDADAAFRVRVLDRLQRSQPRRFGWLGPLVLASAAGVALAVVLAVVLTRAPKPAPVTVSGANPPSAVTPPASPSAPAARQKEPRRPVVTTAPVRERTLRAAAAQQIPRGLVVATVAAEEPAVQIDPLLSIEPIAVTPLDTPPIDAEQIVVAPLAAIEGVQIEPLTPRIERD